MSELSFEQMLEDSVKTIRNGEIVQGTVIDVKEDEIILNIGYKADGIITKNEYTNDSSLVLTDAVKRWRHNGSKSSQSKRWRRTGYSYLQETGSRERQQTS